MRSTAPASMAERPSTGAAAAPIGRIGILAGGGRLPEMIADSVLQRGGSVHIVAIEGEADASVTRFPHTWVNWGHVGRMVATLRARADAMVIAGGVRRPDLWKLRPDLGFFLSLPQILEMLAGGDDSVLSRVVRFFEAKGIVVRGAHEVAPDLLALSGPAGALALDEQGRADAELGFAVRAALGALDAGQAVVVAGGKVLAIEGAEGTDAMLARVGGLRGGTHGGAPNDVPSGVLAKGPKPGQELRVDMPAVGPRTVAAVAEGGLAGMALEAGAVLLLDRGEAVAAANARGIAIEGLPTGNSYPEIRQGASHRVPSPLVGQGQGGGEPRTSKVGVPPTPSPSPQGGGNFRRDLAQWTRENPGSTIYVAGGLQPEARASADIDKGLAAVARLAPFGTGNAVVVARSYILAIAAAEPTLAMLERTRGLRQWGVGAKRRVGVLVCRPSAAECDPAGVEALLERAAAAGLAGVAVAGPPGTLAAFEAAGGLADGHGLFLVTRREQP